MYAKDRIRIGFALTPEEFKELKKNMKFYNCKTYSQYFKMKLRTDRILFEEK